MAAALAALAAAASPATAVAADIGLSVTTDWQPALGMPGWAAYTVTLTDRGGDLAGSLDLLPRNLGGSGSSSAETEYVTPFQVGHGSTESFPFYALASPSGYVVEVRDGSGAVVARASTTGAFMSGFGKGFAAPAIAVGVLTDSASVRSALSVVDVARTPVRPIAFGGRLPFPASPLELEGLDAIVLDSYDTGSLTPSQLAALRDYVAFGGSLVLAAGSDWPRTVLPLPSQLTPLRPQGTSVASLDALAQMAERHSSLRVTVATGPVKGQVVVADSAGSPLVVDSTYGEGQVVELTFDPASPAIAGSDLANLIWSQALSRAGPTSSSPTKFAPPGPGVPVGSGVVVGPAVSVGVSLGSRSTVQAYELPLLRLLLASPAARLPSIALLGSVLLGYLVLVGPVNYALLHRFGRRNLFWLTVPLAALVASGGLYAVGSGLRGGNFKDQAVELIRPAPGGSAMVVAYHGILSPRRGDVTLDIPRGALVTTEIGSGYGIEGGGTSPDKVLLGRRPQVQLTNMSIWSMKTVEMESVVHMGVGLRADLSERSGALVGTIVNTGTVRIRDLQIYLGRQRARVGATLAPGASLAVDAPLATYASALSGSGRVGSQEQVASESAAISASATAGQVIVTGLVPSSSLLSVEGGDLASSVTAAVAFPVDLRATDRLSGDEGRPQLVSSASSGSGLVDVYEVRLPAVAGALAVHYGPPLGPPIDSLAVYDWSSRGWRSLGVNGARPAGSAPLLKAETAGGLVRLRVHEAQPFGSLQVVSGT